MLPFSYLFEEIPPSALKSAIKQATVWGLSGGLAAKLSGQKKKMTKEEKQQLTKDVAIAGGSGIAAGAIGSLI